MSEKEILDACLKKLNLTKQLRSLIWYGSRKKGADIDLLAVFDPEIPSEYRPGEILDIYSISLQEFERLAYLFDPIVTEPILTGELLLGNKKQLEKLKKNLSGIFPSKEIITHLRARSHGWYSEHIKFLATYEKMGAMRDKNFLLYALIDLSYTASYDSFTLYYSKEQQKGLVTLKELEKRNLDSVLLRILIYLRKAKRNKDLLNLEKIRALAKEWNNGMT